MSRNRRSRGAELPAVGLTELLGTLLALKERIRQELVASLIGDQLQRIQAAGTVSKEGEH